MHDPTPRELDVLSKAARAAQNAAVALSELKAFLDFVALSPSAAGIKDADFNAMTPNGAPAAGVFRGFDPATFTAFITAAQGVVGAIAANDSAVGHAFAAMSEWNR